MKYILYKTLFIRDIEKKIFKIFRKNFWFLNNQQNIWRLNFETMNPLMLMWTLDSFAKKILDMYYNGSIALLSLIHNVNLDKYGDIIN